MFTFGFVGPVCNDHGPIVQESISVIKDACDEFDPVGSRGIEDLADRIATLALSMR